jgi:hypothetical protein
MISPTEEDFELELRALPGVVNVGFRFSDKGDVEGVSLVVAGGDVTPVRIVAKQIVSLYYPNAAITVEEMKTAPTAVSASGSNIVELNRVVLVRAEFNSHEGNCEVHLTLNGRIGIGRSANGPLIGGAEATLDALRQLNLDVPFYLVSSITVATLRGWPVIVTLRPTFNDADRFGIAQADSELVAATKATLGALNRFLSQLNLFA